MSRTPEQLAHKLEVLAVRVELTPRQIVRQGALIARQSIKSTLGKARMRNVGKGGVRLGVGFRTTGGVRAPAALLRATPPGPWRWREEGTGPHRIPKAGTGHRIKLPDGGYRWSVQHLGSKGTHPFERGAHRAEPLVRAVSIREFVKVGHGVF